MQPQQGSRAASAHSVRARSTHYVPRLYWELGTGCSANMAPHPCLRGIHIMDSADPGVGLLWFPVPAFSPADCVTSGQRPNLSESIFSFVKRGMASSLAELLRA